jgi:hypothetical protein
MAGCKFFLSTADTKAVDVLFNAAVSSQSQLDEGIDDQSTVLEVYLSRDEHLPIALRNGDLKKEIDSETWL